MYVKSWAQIFESETSKKIGNGLFDFFESETSKKIGNGLSDFVESETSKKIGNGLSDFVESETSKKIGNGLSDFVILYQLSEYKAGCTVSNNGEFYKLLIIFYKKLPKQYIEGFAN